DGTSKPALALALLVAASISILFFTSFFKNWRGAADSILTYANYFHRAAGEDSHNKPWWYYLKLLLWNRSPVAIWSEGFVVLLALIGACSGFLSTLPHPTLPSPV